MSSLPVLKAKSVTMQVTEKDGELVLRATGYITDPEPGRILYPYFETVNETVRAMKKDRITLDIKGLVNVDSSGIVCFLRWAKQVQNLGSDRFIIKVLYDPEVLWQRISLRSLCDMAPDVIQIAG